MCRRTCVCVCTGETEMVGSGLQEPGHPCLPGHRHRGRQSHGCLPAPALFLLWLLTRCPVYPGLRCHSFPLLSLLSTPGNPTSMSWTPQGTDGAARFSKRTSSLWPNTLPQTSPLKTTYISAHCLQGQESGVVRMGSLLRVLSS